MDKRQQAAQDRQDEVRAAVLTWRSLAQLDAEIREVLMIHMGIRQRLAHEQSRARVLAGLYEAVVELAVRTGDWLLALDMVRDTDTTNAPDVEVWAYSTLVAQTAELYV